MKSNHKPEDRQFALDLLSAIRNQDKDQLERMQHHHDVETFLNERLPSMAQTDEDIKKALYNKEVWVVIDSGQRDLSPLETLGHVYLGLEEKGSIQWRGFYPEANLPIAKGQLRDDGQRQSEQYQRIQKSIPVTQEGFDNIVSFIKKTEKNPGYWVAAYAQRNCIDWVNQALIQAGKLDGLTDVFSERELNERLQKGRLIQSYAKANYIRIHNSTQIEALFLGQTETDSEYVSQQIRRKLKKLSQEDATRAQARSLDHSVQTLLKSKDKLINPSKTTRATRPSQASQLQNIQELLQNKKSLDRDQLKALSQISQRLIQRFGQTQNTLKKIELQNSEVVNLLQRQRKNQGWQQQVADWRNAFDLLNQGANLQPRSGLASIGQLGLASISLVDQVHRFSRVSTFSFLSSLGSIALSGIGLIRMIWQLRKRRSSAEQSIATHLRQVSNQVQQLEQYLVEELRIFQVRLQTQLGQQVRGAMRGLAQDLQLMHEDIQQDIRELRIPIMHKLEDELQLLQQIDNNLSLGLHDLKLQKFFIRLNDIQAIERKYPENSPYLYHRQQALPGYADYFQFWFERNAFSPLLNGLSHPGLTGAPLVAFCSQFAPENKLAFLAKYIQQKLQLPLPVAPKDLPNLDVYELALQAYLGTRARLDKRYYDPQAHDLDLAIQVLLPTHHFLQYLKTQPLVFSRLLEQYQHAQLQFSASFEHSLKRYTQDLCTRIRHQLLAKQEACLKGIDYQELPQQAVLQVQWVEHRRKRSGLFRHHKTIHIPHQAACPFQADPSPSLQGQMTLAQENITHKRHVNSLKQPIACLAYLKSQSKLQGLQSVPLNVQGIFQYISLPTPLLEAESLGLGEFIFEIDIRDLATSRYTFMLQVRFALQDQPVMDIAEIACEVLQTTLEEESAIHQFAQTHQHNLPASFLDEHAQKLRFIGGWRQIQAQLLTSHTGISCRWYEPLESALRPVRQAIMAMRLALREEVWQQLQSERDTAICREAFQHHSQTLAGCHAILEYALRLTGFPPLDSFALQADSPVHLEEVVLNQVWQQKIHSLETAIRLYLKQSINGLQQPLRLCLKTHSPCVKPAHEGDWYYYPDQGYPGLQEAIRAGLGEWGFDLTQGTEWGITILKLNQISQIYTLPKAGYCLPVWQDAHAYYLLYPIHTKASPPEYHATHEDPYVLLADLLGANSGEDLRQYIRQFICSHLAEYKIAIYQQLFQDQTHIEQLGYGCLNPSQQATLLNFWAHDTSRALLPEIYTQLVSHYPQWLSSIEVDVLNRCYGLRILAWDSGRGRVQWACHQAQIEPDYVLSGQTGHYQIRHLQAQRGGSYWECDPQPSRAEQTVATCLQEIQHRRQQALSYDLHSPGDEGGRSPASPPPLRFSPPPSPEAVQEQTKKMYQHAEPII